MTVRDMLKAVLIPLKNSKNNMSIVRHLVETKGQFENGSPLAAFDEVLGINDSKLIEDYERTMDSLKEILAAKELITFGIVKNLYGEYEVRCDRSYAYMCLKQDFERVVELYNVIANTMPELGLVEKTLVDAE